ncbi:hypothetical protein TNCV_4682541 [Trichonephila clavipes]|nr:hypothetical protein TNCV_4682541 [Trichonephila clavipes]
MNLVHFMDEDKTMEFNVIQPKENKPIKVVIKELPRCTKPQDIVTDLEELGYTVTSCNHNLFPQELNLISPFSQLLCQETPKMPQFLIFPGWDT